MYYISVENGVRLAVEDLNPRGRHAVVFVHGWPLSRRIFEYQTNILPRADIRCVSYDLRGYGDSDKPFHGYSYDRMADDLRQVLQSLDCRTVTLLGFSMGGAICTRYMARHKGYKVHKLVLCGAACPQFAKSPESPYGMEVGAVNGLIAQTLADRPAMCGGFGKLCFATGVSEAYRRWFEEECSRAAGHATYMGLEELRDESLYEDLHCIQAPTLILHGKKDLVCPFPLALEMKKHIPNATLAPFEQSGHCLFFEEKERFNQELVRFVKEN